ncbi:peptidase E [Longimicrobium sp.]|uniref:Type 1 glutamine amidotransferase-like domain-containing protein n=1 Tax=Longimicrobium sp. TaxID=2029185 RepID=UPI002C7BA4CC|nr:peptidase E [Longimicrobium sp.]HSU17112.1 peptidase E [Longimicrobium sp.]
MPSHPGQIIAMGGGGFTMEPDNPLLDQYVLAATGKRHPRVCFVPTAAGDAIGYIDRFGEAFPPDVCEPTYLSLFSRKFDDLAGFLCEQDLVYVGGGNTVNLLAVWRAQGMDRAVAEALAAGTIFCGVSAGALCWFERGITDSYSPDLKPLTNGLGFLPGAFSPHYDSDRRRPVLFPEFVRRFGAPALAAEDGVALHFRDGQLVRAVSSRPEAVAFRFTLAEGEVTTERITPTYLGREAAAAAG